MRGARVRACVRGARALLARARGWALAGPRFGMLAAVCAGLLGSCASLEDDWHVAPFYSSLDRHDGGRTTEILGGMYLAEDPPPGYEGSDEETGRRVRALRPFFSNVDHVDGTRTIEWLVPLGKTRYEEEETSSRFFPFYTARATPPDGKGRVFSLLVLPGIFYTEDEGGDSQWAWLPFWGDLENFLTFSRLRFILFPLYLHTERAGNRTDNLLFPVFSWTRPVGVEPGDPVAPLEERAVRGWRVWPLFGHVEREESYDRTFALWPVFHLQHNHIERGENSTKQWAVFPFFTSTRMGTYRGYTVLWPFFGWATDPRGDFWSLDAPWPIVRFQRGGENTGDVSRSRVWPFFSHMRGDGIEMWSVAWPIVQWNVQDYRGFDKRAQYVLPFWRSWTSTIDEGALEGQEIASWRKLWPLWSRHAVLDERTTTLLPLNPLWRSEWIDFHWGWLYELYRETEDGPVKRERSWLGLWWRERNAAEDRRSLAGLWSRRVVANEGRAFAETSLLFGLIRWRSGDDAGLMRPALPGPGWPALEQAPVRSTSAPRVFSEAQLEGTP